MIEDLLAGRKTERIVDPAQFDLTLTVSFDIELKNDTRARLAFTGLDYGLDVNGGRLVAERTTDIRNASGRTLLHLSNTFSSKALSGAVLEALSSRKGE